MSKETKKDKIVELGYTIEALEDEIEYLKGEHATNRARIWELIEHNDRLTLTYEPYRPPGDEDENTSYYDLKEENDMLTQKVLDKMALTDELDGRISKLVTENYELRRTIQANNDIVYKATKKTKSRVKNDRWWNFNIELWPGAWGLNYYRYDWKKYNADTREGQMQIGPLGFSWNREPKR